MVEPDDKKKIYGCNIVRFSRNDVSNLAA